jgi:hypothetical protein
MDLGSFSVSLSVKDLKASRDFYAKLGFEPAGGNADEHWLILRNGDHVIGLFQGMFQDNILTFNPGWDQQGNETSAFMDVREIGPMTSAAPNFPGAGSALGPLKKMSEAMGRDDFSSLWCGQSASLCTSMPAGALTKKLAADAFKLMAVQD